MKDTIWSMKEFRIGSVLAVVIVLAACSSESDPGKSAGGGPGSGGSGGSAAVGGAAGSGGGMANCQPGDGQQCANITGYAKELECPPGVDLTASGCKYAGDWAIGGTDAGTLSGPYYCCPQ